MESVTNNLCLKAMIRLNLTQSKLLNTICQKQEEHPKQKLSLEENTTRDGAYSTRAATRRSPTAGEYQKPLGATRNDKRDGAWPSRATQGMKKHLGA
jgi:hypothetical protein